MKFLKIDYGSAKQIKSECRLDIRLVDKSTEEIESNIKSYFKDMLDGNAM